MSSTNRLILELEERIRQLSVAGEALRVQAETDETGDELALAIDAWDTVLEAHGTPGIGTSVCDTCFTVTMSGTPCPACRGSACSASD